MLELEAGGNTRRTGRNARTSASVLWARAFLDGRLLEHGNAVPDAHLGGSMGYVVSCGVLCVVCSGGKERVGCREFPRDGRKQVAMEART